MVAEILILLICNSGPLPCDLTQNSTVLAVNSNQILTAIIQGMRKEEPR